VAGIVRQHQRILKAKFRGTDIAAVVLVWLASAAIAPHGVAEEVETPPEPAFSVLESLERLPLPLEPKPLSPDTVKLCEDKPAGGLAWIDRMRASIYRRTCLAVAGFDGYFGNAHFDDEYEATYGRLAVARCGTSAINGIRASGLA
jgi:hypothetical protein